MKVLITTAEELIARTQNPYLKIAYVTATGEVLSALDFEKPFEAKDIIGKVCEVTILTGDRAPKITSITVLDDDPKSFYRHTKLDVEMMFNRLLMTAQQITDEALRKITVEMLEGKRGERLKQWPAGSKLHHCFSGGLLEHTYGMLTIFEAMKSDPSLRGIDVDVVRAAVIVHDIAKVATYDFDLKMTIERNNLESLIGHLVMADEWVTNIARKHDISTTGNKKVLNLRHCILAHHGKKEWGSPVVPSTREAVIVHQLDMIQAKSEIAIEAFNGVEEGKRSQFNRSLETEMIRL